MHGVPFCNGRFRAIASFASHLLLPLFVALTGSACEGYGEDSPSNLVAVTRECQSGDERPCGVSLGACSEGKQQCEGGYWGHCSGAGPSSESCDGEDNDCDGDVDEGCECEAGTSRPCGTAVGECELGVQECTDRRWAACSGSVEPRTETCDGKDNDCDGIVDDGFDVQAPCDSSGICPQRRTCRDGVSVCENDPALFSEEICDGVDNDCDGIVDRISEGGELRSVCTCQTRTLTIGAADDRSIGNAVNLCATTRCGGDTSRRRSLDGKCWAVCEDDPDSDGDGWGFENGGSCMIASGDPWERSQPCDGEGIPLGMSLRYCLECGADGGPLPYALCQSTPRFDLTPFGAGEKWLRVDYSFSADTAAGVPVSLWFDADGETRKRLPLVKVGDTPGRYQRLLRAKDACFVPSSKFGSKCERSDTPCPHCGSDEDCGVTTKCDAYDLRQAWIQLAAEFCQMSSGRQAGTVTIHRIDLVDPNCDD